MDLPLVSLTVPTSDVVVASWANSAGVSQRPRKAMPKFLFISDPLKKQPLMNLGRSIKQLRTGENASRKAFTPVTGIFVKIHTVQ
jgi:hypothetical protein